MPSLRVRALLASAGLLALPFGVLALTGAPSASAAPHLAASGEPTPSPTTILPFPGPTSASPTPGPTPEPTAPPTTAAPAPTPTPTSLRTSVPVRTSSPKPKPTYTERVTSTADPITGGVDVDTVPAASPDSSVTAAPVPASSSGKGGDHVRTLITLVVAGALMLGVGGAAGLYLTRHRHEH